jgi:hypothetical protein
VSYTAIWFATIEFTPRLMKFMRRKSSKMPAAEIKFDQSGIATMLHTGLYSVPKYQREFKWESSHVRELFNDIENSLVDQQPEYFLGSIVLSKADAERPDIVDGQQRLASVSILFAGIRDHYIESGDQETAQYIEQRFLLEKNPVTKDVTPRLQLGDADNEFFEKAILGRPGSSERTFQPKQESHRRMQQAQVEAANYVKKMTSSGSNPDEQIFRRVSYLEKSVLVIVVKVPDEANAFVIFETLNDRGLDLATTDLIKNYLFGKSGSKISEVQHRWLSMTSAITAAKDERAVMDYVRHQWSANYELTRQKELFVGIRNKIKNATSALDYATQLASDARVYAAMLNTDLDFWNDYGMTARQQMQAIELIGIDRMRPLVLATLSHFTVKEAKKALQLFVGWSVRFLVASTNWGTLERQFSVKASQISAGVINDAKGLQAAMKSYIPPDNDFEGEFATTSLSNSVSRYVLYALERKQAGTKQPELVANVNTDDVSLEHILPKNPATGTWKAFDPETVSVWARKLGNLCLLASDENGAATNAEFSDKKAIYAKSALKLTVEVANHTQWDAKAIQDRQKQLAQLAVKAWQA